MHCSSASSSPTTRLSCSYHCVWFHILISAVKPLRSKNWNSNSSFALPSLPHWAYNARAICTWALSCPAVSPRQSPYNSGPGPVPGGRKPRGCLGGNAGGRGGSAPVEMVVRKRLPSVFPPSIPGLMGLPLPPQSAQVQCMPSCSRSLKEP